MSVKILCDSACDMTRAEAEEKGVILLPLKTIIDGVEYRDGVDIDGEEFYRKLLSCRDFPKTSQVSPDEFLRAYEEAGRENELLVISIAHSLSGTVQSAAIAAAEFGGNVRIVDSRSVTAGERILLEYAIKLRDEGKSAREIEIELCRVRDRIVIVARADTLEYLRKGGRISKTAAIAGSVLNIKPVLGMERGELKIFGKARGIKQSHNMLNEIIRKKGGVDFSMPIMLAYSGNDRSLLNAYIEHSRPLWEGKTDKLPVCIVGSTIGSHAGPGAVGVAFFSR